MSTDSLPKNEHGHNFAFFMSPIIVVVARSAHDERLVWRQRRRRAPRGRHKEEWCHHLPHSAVDAADGERGSRGASLASGHNENTGMRVHGYLAFKH